jgi:hypothetical protein
MVSNGGDDLLAPGGNGEIVRVAEAEHELRRDERDNSDWRKGSG